MIKGPQADLSDESKMTQLKKISLLIVKYMMPVWAVAILLLPDRLEADTHVRQVTQLRSDWLFMQKDLAQAASINLDDRSWNKVTLPHDWAISGPFDYKNDLQTVKVSEDGDLRAATRSGRTGGLPVNGVGWYRRHFFINSQDKGRCFSIEFDGAMSHAKVYLNEHLVGEWPYGYTSFSFDLTPYLVYGGDNVLAVRLENPAGSARWYSGAGIYRNVRLVSTNKIHFLQRNAWITSSEAANGQAEVHIQSSLENEGGLNKDLEITTKIFEPGNREVGTVSSVYLSQAGCNQTIRLLHPKKWSSATPFLYRAEISVKKNGEVLDQISIPFGIRFIRFSPQKGMIVNGRPEKLKGVCLHDDLGPLGMAVNKSALRYRLQLLREMGCNAIRGSHNPHAPELMDMCDEMGFYFIDEAFDEWKTPKVKNGYHLLFDEWAEKDLSAMIVRDRNHPSVIMYSIGNEVREQGEKTGAAVAGYLTAICHRLDSTRPVTAGFNNLQGAIKNGLAEKVDIPGWNYKPEEYNRIHKQHPDWVVYGSETASTVSSRGVYKLPADTATMKIWPDNQSSSYDLEYCRWSQLPDMEWQQQEADFVAGEFAWTGFDYLGEPTPYMDNWPSRSSYFGIIDLCGLPKDRYYLYQSHWSEKKVLHLLPHWNWEGKEGQIIPVYVYTNYPSAEVFINGVSYGKKYFDVHSLLDRYRLRWYNTVYTPGELKVVAYDADGHAAATQIVHTAGTPAEIHLQTQTRRLLPDGTDLAFITVSVKDKAGNLCPLADNNIHFKVSGAGTLCAVGSGNPASLESFQADERKAFYGQCMLIVQGKTEPGMMHISAEAPGLQSAEISIPVGK